MNASDNLEEIARLIAQLASKDIRTRVHARHALAEIGHQAVPDLIQGLEDDSDYIRWEAARILGILKDKRAAPALVRALMDERHEVRWVSAEALIALGHQSLTPLLIQLEKDFDSQSLREGAYHVLHGMEQKQLLSPELLQVLDSLRVIEPEVHIGVSAQKALWHLTLHGRRDR